MNLPVNVVFYVRHLVTVKTDVILVHARPMMKERYTLSPEVYKLFETAYVKKFGKMIKDMKSNWEVVDVRHHMSANWIEVELIHEHIE